MIWVGLDLHRRYVTACALDDAGQVKTDPIDARKLAELLRTNLLPRVWVPSVEVRARRKLLRGRAYLVRVRTQLKNRIHGL